MNDTNFSLLNQQEIDTLVDFLSKSREEFDSDVLNQDSIDKLIRIIRHDDLSTVRLDELDSIHIKLNILKDLGIRDDSSQLCELSFHLDPETQFVIITATNRDNGKSYTITPSSLNRLEALDGISSWGYSIPPISFNKIARIFQCKYSRQTYEDICALFALKNYGSRNQQLPSLYYPTTQQLLASLL
ncbi:MAG: hypothetical protein ACOCNB_09430 [Acetivibrio ethanolgignens]